MSKIIDVFERLNLIEKANNEERETSSTSDIDEVEEKEPPKVEQYARQPDTSISDSVKDGGQAANKYNYAEDRNMSIVDIYTKFGMEDNSVNTIFMLEKFINALPENLPFEIKKQSLINILEASNTNLNTLISDGEKRLNILNNFANDYCESVTNNVEQYKSEILKLNNIIDNYKEQIHLKESMLSEQNNVIKFETERINSTINFFRNND